MCVVVAVLYVVVAAVVYYHLHVAAADVLHNVVAYHPKNQLQYPTICICIHEPVAVVAYVVDDVADAELVALTVLESLLLHRCHHSYVIQYLADRHQFVDYQMTMLRQQVSLDVDDDKQVDGFSLAQPTNQLNISKSNPTYLRCLECANNAYKCHWYCYN